MSDYNSRDIYFSLNEYRSNYNNLLNDFLSKHDDFDEINFIEHELDLYDLCLENATLTLYTYKGEYKYAVNFGNCRFIISKIYDSLVTFKKENDGWDLELALKYQVTFKKIIEFLRERKDFISDIKTKKYNNLLSNSKTPEVRKLLTKILHNDITFFNVINYINDNINKKTHDLFLKEFNSCCQFIFNEFMFKVKDDDIKKALEIFENNLEYVYAYEGELEKFSVFIKDFGTIKTVYNVSGLFEEQKENTIRLVYLNNMMIDYYDGFFANPIENFENISSLKYVYNHLNGIERKHNSSIDEDIQDKTEDNTNVNIENDYLKSSIEDYLEPVTEFIDTANYGILVDALYSYFTTSKFPKLDKKIIFKRVNKKKVGWALKEVYKNNKQDNLDIEYFRFAQENINLFDKEVIVEEGFLQSKFYKVFTTNPDK